MTTEQIVEKYGPYLVTGDGEHKPNVQGQMELQRLVEATEDKTEVIRALFVNLINERFSRNIRDISVTELPVKLQRLINEDHLPYFKLHQEKDKAEPSICILASIMTQLEKNNLTRLSLKDLADLIGFNYKPVKVHGKPARVAMGSLEDFERFLLPAVQLQEALN
jgi:hypothetical protein